MDLNYTYDFYDTVAYSVPLAFLVCSPTSIFLMVFTGYLSYLLCFGEEDTYNLWDSVFKIIKQIYGDHMEKAESGDYTLHGRPLPKWKVLVLFVTIVSMYFCTVVSFWSDLLVEQSNGGCERKFDCFAFNASTGNMVQPNSLLDNCSLFENEDYFIECYRFAFNYINAIGNAGSVLVIGTLVMNVQTSLFSWLLTIREAAKSRTKVILSTSAYYVTFASTFITFVVVPPILLLIPVIRRGILTTKNSYVQLTAYYTTFTLAYVASGPVYVTKLKCCSGVLKKVKLDDAEKPTSGSSKGANPEAL